MTRLNVLGRRAPEAPALSPRQVATVVGAWLATMLVMAALLVVR